MGYVVTIVIVVLGFASQVLIETSAELSTEVLLETDAGVDLIAPRITTGEMIDVSPASSVDAPAEPRLYR
jgi:hypothetical protein